MWAFLKPLIESDTNVQDRHVDANYAADDDDHIGSDHDDHHPAAGLRSRGNPDPTKKPQ